nr:MAG TPA: zinc-ribbon containing domain protein [Caudoviricetes sp.]
MTPENAIKILKGLYPDLSLAGKAAIDAAVEALEKQIPKKPDGGYDIFYGEDAKLCPVCGDPRPDTYCGTCGQRLDWSDENGTND